MDTFSHLSRRAKERATVAGFMAGVALTSVVWFALWALLGVSA